MVILSLNLQASQRSFDISQLSVIQPNQKHLDLYQKFSFSRHRPLLRLICSAFVLYHHTASFFDLSTLPPADINMSCLHLHTIMSKVNDKCLLALRLKSRPSKKRGLEIVSSLQLLELLLSHACLRSRSSFISTLGHSLLMATLTDQLTHRLVCTLRFQRRSHSALSWI